LQDYAQMCGVDYANRSIAPKAFEGPWELPSAMMPEPPKPLGVATPEA
jgi:hypothetical protein